MRLSDSARHFIDDLSTALIATVALIVAIGMSVLGIVLDWSYLISLDWSANSVTTKIGVAMLVALCAVIVYLVVESVKDLYYSVIDLRHSVR